MRNFDLKKHPGAWGLGLAAVAAQKLRIKTILLIPSKLAIKSALCQAEPQKTAPIPSRPTGRARDGAK